MKPPETAASLELSEVDIKAKLFTDGSVLLLQGNDIICVRKEAFAALVAFVTAGGRTDA